MAKKAVDLVAANVSRLVSQAGLSNAALEKKAAGRLTRSTIDRVRRGQGSVGVDSLAELARVFGLELWQLCVEDLDPEHLPTLGSSTLSASPEVADEGTLLRHYRELSPAFRQLVLNDVERYLQAQRQTEDKKGASLKRHA